ncbi:MAG: MFS transporter [Myxococcota bacterium]
MSTPSDSSSSALRSYQIRTFVLTWLSYAGFYLTRKPVSVVKARLQDEQGISTATLGLMDTGYLTAYAIGQFVSGMLGDRLGARKLLALGMLGTALCSVAFGMSGSGMLLVLFWCLNGFFQSSGWPGNIKAMTPWFGSTSRGKVMGVWSTCYQVGGIVGTALAAWLLAQYGWRSPFFVPAVLVAGVGLLIFFFLVQHPRDVGLQGEGVSPSDSTSSTPPSPVEQEAPLGVLETLKLPGILNLGAAYFCLKLIRYTLLFWLPYYLSKVLLYPEDTAGYLSTSFEVGGVVGAIVVGYLSDKYFAGRRVTVAAPLVFCIGGAMLIYLQVGTWGMWFNAGAMALVGFLLFGPDSLLSGAAAQDLGGARAAGSAAGVINGMGSVGAILQGQVTSVVAEQYGWNTLFYVLVGLSTAGALALLPLFLRERARAKA